MKKPRFGIGTIGKYTVLSLFALIQLFPLYWLFSFSLKDNAEIFSKNTLGLPAVFHWEHYVNMFKAANIDTYLINSVIVTFASILISTALAAMSPYDIPRLKWKQSNKVLLLFLAGMMIPLHATLVPLLVMFTRTHIYDTYWALILPYSAFALPIAIFIFVGFMQTIPRELIEAACIDGMNIYGVFTRIMLPLIRPAIATVAIFTYLSCWNELMFAIAFMGGETHKTITAGVLSMVGRYSTQWGQVGAGLVIATIPTLVVYILLSKQIQKSFTTGALKG
jgi:raffinose/stachyose/melibiose transport system permease protein